MADSKITALTALTAADPANDMIPIVDVSDTPPASGNTKRISINNILACSPSATLASATITGDLTVDTSTLKVDSANDRVGIGTASPVARLIVRDGANRNLLVASDASHLGSAGIAIGSFTDNAADWAPLSLVAKTSIAFGLNGTTAMTLNSDGLGILNSNPFSGNSSGLTIGTLGSGSAKQITLQMANCYARMRERNVVNDFAITTNINVDNVLDDNTRPSWMIRLGAGSDLFSVFRAAAASTSFTTLATVNPSGDFNLIGNIVPISGKGIDFSATPDQPGRTSELLNDYEEGTWVATVRGTVSDPTVPLTSTCRYTKIGRQVFVEGVIDGNTTGASGQVFISSLPFASAAGNNERPGSVQLNNIATFTGYATAYIASSQLNVNFYSSTSGGALGNVVHNPGAGRTIWFGITYTV